MLLSLYDWCKINGKEELIDEWDINNEKTIYEVSKGSNYNASWVCKDGHKYKRLVKERTGRNRGCPICMKRTHTSFPEQAIFYYVKKEFPDAINSYKDLFDNNMELDIYIPSLKIGIEYDGYFFHKSQSKQYKDSQKYSICYAKGIRLIRVKQGGLTNKAPLVTCDEQIVILKSDSQSLNYAIQQLFFCLGRFVYPDVKKNELEIYKYLYSLNKKNFLSEYPEIAKEWDYEKNEGLRPEMFPPVAGNTVFWKCAKGHSFKQKISNRVNGNSCPLCYGRYAIEGENDLESLYPDLMKEWDYEKNGKLGLNPRKIKPRSDIEAFWICSVCGFSSKAVIKSRTKGYGCRRCGNAARGKALSKKVYSFELDGKLIKEYSSLHEASIESKISSSRLCRACCKKGKTVINGIYWTYSNLFDYNK